ncbi:hypothetical protein [Luteimonas cucumeris]|uniref:hypothetical protein n=1 Tax=Luteimonas cucumeris TaxID=985012 RepID=UPI0011AB0C45|nr:hypothetical protein [Luteimonas cucumeris]
MDQLRPNNSFKPNFLRSTNNMAGRACHVVGSATQVGLTQALGLIGRFTMLKELLLAAQLASAPMSFDQAKALADANEANLSKEMSSQLLPAQGNALGSAMATCGRPGMDLSAFTVVFSLNTDGSVAESWRKGETPLAQCVHKAISAAGLAGQWPTPFYTSIELSFNEP